jgi:putative transposase
MRYAFIKAHAECWPITVLCRVLRVTTSGYYAWRARRGSSQPDGDDRLCVVIRAVFNEHRGNYGVPRMTRELRFLGHRVNHKRVARLMREMRLQGRQRRRFKPRTTVADPGGPVFPDLIKQEFTASARNQRWVGDITYLQTTDGFDYLATVLDLYSRRIVGWALGSDITASLVVDALTMAIQNRRPDPGVIFHSDRGCQYTSGEFRRACDQASVQQSMGRTGCCYDNAAAETFFHSLKVEWLHGREIMDRQEVRSLVFQYIEAYYNSNRRHATLGYLSPCEFERNNSAGRHDAPPRSAAQRAPDQRPGDASRTGTPGISRHAAVRPPAGRSVPAPPGCLPPAGTRALYHETGQPGQQH